jgi:protein-disulfide isomerase
MGRLQPHGQGCSQTQGLLPMRPGLVMLKFALRIIRAKVLAVELRPWFFLPLLAALLFPSANPAQTSDDLKSLKKQIDEIQEGQKEIRKQIEALRDLLLIRQNLVHPGAPVDLDLEGAPFQGNPRAKVTLVEFFDYQCPFCGLHFSRTLPKLMIEYVHAGKVKYVLRDLPLEMMHPHAFKAAEAASCAEDQGKFWPMHDS